MGSGEVQGDECKRTTDEASKTSTDDVNTGRLALFQDKSGREPVYCLGDSRHKGGVNLNQVFVWNVGTNSSDGKEEKRVENSLG
jgi:hypothetical protein